MDSLFAEFKFGPGIKALFGKIQSRGSRIRPNAKVTVYQDFVKHDGLIVVPEVSKCNRKAAKLRQEGNRLYLAKKYDSAMPEYNESLCYSEPGSEHLGMAYANRSAIFYEEGEYEFALVNIALAKRNHYPEKLMPKLLEREQKCRAKLDDGQSKGTVARPPLDINVAVNPKIPFVADGIAMKRYLEFGRGLVAEKDFLPGDIILNEQPMFTISELGTRYHNCSSCSTAFRESLIPCPGCVSAMYCSEECLRKDYQHWHRFECGVSEKLRNITYATATLAPKRFFYGLSLFGDDLQKMMDYCERSANEDDDPFALDYTKGDLLQEWKVLHNAKINPVINMEAEFRLMAAAYYSVFMKHPLVKRIVSSEVKKTFMLKCFLDYIRKDTALTLATTLGLTFSSICTLSSVSSLVNHSCDPNIVFHIACGRMYFVVIRPITAGEQIITSYGPTWYEPQPKYQSIYTCRCPVCDDSSDWCVRENTLPRRALEQLQRINSGGEEKDSLGRLQKFLIDYGHCHPDGSLGPKIGVYRFMLIGMIHDGTQTLERARAAAMAD